MLSLVGWQIKKKKIKKGILALQGLLKIKGTLKMKKILVILVVLLFATVSFATVSAGETIRESFACTGGTTYTFTSKGYSASDYKVYQRLADGTGEPVLLIKDVNYTIAYTGSSYQEGGVVTISPALSTDYEIVIVRDLIKTQSTPPASFNATTGVAADDKVMRLIQELQNKWERTIHLGAGDDDATLVIPKVRASMIPIFDSNGNLTVADLTDIGDVNIYANVINMTDGTANIDGGLSIISESTNTITGGTITIVDANTITGGTITIVDANYYRNVKDYGAKGDGVTDDTNAIAAAIAAGRSIFFGDSNNTYIVSSTLTISESGTKIWGNGAKIKYTFEQVIPAYTESLFYVNGANNVTIDGLILEYTGTFDEGSSLAGYISGIQVEDSNNFTAKNLEIYGFNRAGISISTVAAVSDYSYYPVVKDCFIHGNRVAGILFGNTDRGIVENCTLAENGLAGNYDAGYGFAGWSAKYPKNTLITNNRSFNNYRKGIDFHAGQNGTIVNNIVSGNKIYGIYVENNINGNWIISNNEIKDMNYANELPTSGMYGIRIGAYAGRGPNETPTTFVINGNNITNFNKTAGMAFPLADDLLGLSYASATFSNNIISCGTISAFYSGGPSLGSGTAGNYYDLSFMNNQFTATTCNSTAPPIYIRSAYHRHKVFSNNIIAITNITGTAGLVVWDATTKTNHSFIAIGNIISVPATGWSGVYDPISIKRGINEKMSDNVVNGSYWRDWTGRAFVMDANAAPTTNYWSKGSRCYSYEDPNYFFCTTAGSPGSWTQIAD